MGQILLRSRVGPVEFTRRVMIKHESGNQYLAPQTYRFDLDNGFKNTVPSQVWDELQNEFLDRKANLKYREALIPQ